MAKFSLMILTAMSFMIGLGASQQIPNDSFNDIGENHERLYLDMEEVNPADGFFYLHVGDNNWIQTSQIQSDPMGFFTLTCNIKTDSHHMEYEKKWRCPYCNRWWPIGKPCGNAECPSKYK